MIVTLSGANAFRVQLELNKLIATYVGKYGDMGIERVSGAEVSTARIVRGSRGVTIFSRTAFSYC